jgi:hypothetical protein
VKQKHLGVESVARETPQLIDEQLAKLKESFPEAFSEGKVDFEKLKATLGEVVDGPAGTLLIHLGREARLHPAAPDPEPGDAESVP